MKTNNLLPSLMFTHLDLKNTQPRVLLPRSCVFYEQ